MAENRGGGYAVCIVVCEHLDEFLPGNLFGYGFCCGIKWHGLWIIFLMDYLDSRISAVSGLYTNSLGSFLLPV